MCGIPVLYLKVNKDKINNEIRICTAMIDSARHLLEGLRIIGKHSGNRFHRKAAFYRSFISENLARIRQLESFASV